MNADALLLLGPIAAVIFVLVVTVEGARRPGYDASYHTASELALGERGWIMRVNFGVMAVGMAGFALGIQQSLDTLLGGILFGVAATGFLASGVFAMDPVRGFPPGASTRGGHQETLHGKLHAVAGPPVFLAMLAAFGVVAGQLGGAWRLYTLATLLVGAALVVATMTAYRTDAARTGLVQRSLIHLCLLWVLVFGTAESAGLI